MAIRMSVLLVASALALAACGGKKDKDTEQTGKAIAAGEPQTIMGLKNAASFASIADETGRSEALFGEMMNVIGHPRCMNCHPRGDIPRQRDEMRLHVPPVERGEAGIGLVGMECTTCHGPENVAYAGAEGGIPGHPAWHLAPLSMGWLGASPTEICAQLKDPARNGGPHARRSP